MDPEHTMNTPSRTDIRKLSTEAATAGDLAMVAICDRALDGDEAAIAECARVIAEAAAAAAE